MNLTIKELERVVSNIEKTVNIEYSTLQKEINEFRKNYKKYEIISSSEKLNIPYKKVLEFEQRAKIANEKFWGIRQI